MAFNPQGKERSELVAEIRRLEGVESTQVGTIAALQATNASLTDDLAEKTAELATANTALAGANTKIGQLEAAAAKAAPKLKAYASFLVFAADLNAIPPETTP